MKRHGSGTRYRADVQAVGHDCDLALLSVGDEEFWAAPTAMAPLALGELPALQQAVVVVVRAGGCAPSLRTLRLHLMPWMFTRVFHATYVCCPSFLHWGCLLVCL